MVLKRFVGIVTKRDEIEKTLTLEGRSEEMTIPMLDKIKNSAVGHMVHVTIEDDGQYRFYLIPEEQWIPIHQDEVTGSILVHQMATLTDHGSYVTASCLDFDTVATLDSLSLDVRKYPDELKVYLRRMTIDEVKLWTGRGVGDMWIVCGLAVSSSPDVTTEIDMVSDSLANVSIDAELVVESDAPKNSSLSSDTPVPIDAEFAVESDAPLDTSLSSEITASVTSNGLAEQDQPDFARNVPPKVKAIAQLTVDDRQDASRPLKGVVTGVSKDRSKPVYLIYVWTPGVQPGKEGVLFMDNGPSVKIGDWIQFSLPVEKQRRYLSGNTNVQERFICHGSYTVIPEGYITRRVRDTIEFVLPAITIKHDMMRGTYFKHPELGLIYDKEKLLVAGEVMDLLVVRFNPATVDYITCWKVGMAQKSRLNQSSQSANSSTTYDHMQATLDDSVDNEFDVRGTNGTATGGGISPNGTCGNGKSSPSPNNHGQQQQQQQPAVVTAPAPAVPAPLVAEFPRQPFNLEYTLPRRRRSPSPQHRSVPSPVSGAARRNSADIPRDAVEAEPRRGPWTESALVIERQSLAPGDRRNGYLYLVWLLESHRDATIFHHSQLKLGSCFEGLFEQHQDGNNIVIHCRELFEMRPDIMECGMTERQGPIKLVLYTEVINSGKKGFGDHITAWNSHLGSVEDSLNLLKKPPRLVEERVAVVVIYLRTANKGKFGWCITSLQPPVTSASIESESANQEIGKIFIENADFRALLERDEPEVYRLLFLHYFRGVQPY